MATINGLDKMSYAELLKLQERIEAAIAAEAGRGRCGDQGTAPRDGREGRLQPE